jgi:hypothetical protein
MYKVQKCVRDVTLSCWRRIEGKIWTAEVLDLGCEQGCEDIKTLNLNFEK